MAKLDTLQEFDDHLKWATDDILRLQEARGHAPGVWPLEQEEQFSRLFGAVVSLRNAVSALVNRNR